MPDTPVGSKRIRRVAVVLAAWSILAAAIGLYIYQSPQQVRTRDRIARIVQGLGRLFGRTGPARKPVGEIIGEMEQGDEARRGQAIILIPGLTEAELEQVFPHLLRALKDDSEVIRNSAATVIGELSPRLSGNAPAAEKALTRLLDDPSPTLRARAAKSLGSVAASGRHDAPPPRLVACLDDADEAVRAAAIEGLYEYRQGPELIVPVALRRLPTESTAGGEAFADLFWHVRLEPSVLPRLIEGLSSKDAEVRLVCAAAINHMGPGASPAVPAIMSLIRKELDTPHPADSLAKHDRIIGMAAGAIGEATPDGECPPGSVELLCEILKRRGDAIRAAAAASPGAPGASSRILTPEEEVVHEAVWSLGILGRCSSPAVPLLIATFESARKVSNLRGETAEALADISRETPDADRVLALLADAWKSSPQEQKPAIARALRRLSPKAEQLVPELKQSPDDGKGSQIRRYRFPRDRRGFPEPI